MSRERATASAKATAIAAAASGTSAPAQRLTRKGQATRDRIVAAAALEMFERGVARTSLDEVKAAAGVSSSQLYHYFADKRALTLAVIEHQTQAILAGQEPLLSNLDSIEALRAWRDLLTALGVSPGDDHVRAIPCEQPCRRSADAAAGA